MSDGTHIEWTDASWTPFRAWGNEREALGWGCEKVSEGCQHCYAETINRRLGTGLPYSVKAVEKSGGEHYLDEKALLKPLSWKRPRRIFVSSMTDIFGEWVPFDWLDRVFAVMALTPQHTYQVLTKRPERMREYLTTIVVRDGFSYGAEERIFEIAFALAKERNLPGPVWVTLPLPNVWLGTSTENQHWLDIRVPELLATPAAVRFLSCEPLLSGLDLRTFLPATLPALDRAVSGPRGECIDWVVVGGESGATARPCDLAWIRSIVAQCKAAGTACFVKQLGAKPYTSDLGALAAPLAVRRSRLQADGSVHYNLRDRKGGNPDEWAEDLRVREWPV